MKKNSAVLSANTNRNTTKHLLIWAVVVGAILAIPFFSQAPWSIQDYLFAGVVLYGAAFLYEVASKKMQTTHRYMLAGVVLLIIVLIWGWAVA